jgi:GDP/UDP-N,N'-diacetylbacillosamine 2-epimerase (hydrolysing)
VDAMVGNSSSGLAETPSFKIGTINIGDRQKGRIMADSVIDCNSDINSINNAFQILYSSNFKNILLNSVNSYGDGGASKKIKNIIKDVNLDGILKKSFYDITVNLK